MKRVQTLNAISPIGLDVLTNKGYEISSEMDAPDIMLVRSANLHNHTFADNLLAIGRAGAGVNNIPVEQLSEQGVAVFNAPGANANAVKELVMAALFMAARNLYAAAAFVEDLQADLTASDFARDIEASKAKFAGYELAGKRLGVVGLGAIGVQVANAAVSLGMEVYGYDPVISVHNAWHLNSQVHQCHTFEELVQSCQFISFHVPLIEATKHMLSEEHIRSLQTDAVILNFSRDGVVDEIAMLNALDDNQLSLYVTDFPTVENKNHSRVLALPHLGASTQEAEDQSAKLVIEQVVDFIETGSVVNSVNLPEVKAAPIPLQATRLVIVNRNESGVLAKITETLGQHRLNIQDLTNKSKQDLAYTLIDVDGDCPSAVLGVLADIDAIYSVRVCSAS